MGAFANHEQQAPSGETTIRLSMTNMMLKRLKPG
jgi:hypothetical protein